MACSLASSLRCSTLPRVPATTVEDPPRQAKWVQSAVQPERICPRRALAKLDGAAVPHEGANNQGIAPRPLKRLEQSALNSPCLSQGRAGYAHQAGRQPECRSRKLHRCDFGTPQQPIPAQAASYSQPNQARRPGLGKGAGQPAHGQDSSSVLCQRANNPPGTSSWFRA